MSLIPEGGRISFVAGRELHRKEVAKFLRQAESLGLVSDIIVEPVHQGGDIVSRSAELAAHLEATKPTSPESFIGREHFKAIGQQVGKGYKGGRLSKLYTALVFPVIRGENDIMEAVDPASLGLVIQRRDELDPPMPYSPDYKPPTPNRKRQPEGHGARLHNIGNEVKVVNDDLVIQAGSLMAFASDVTPLIDLHSVSDQEIQVISNVAVGLEALIANSQE